MKQDIIKPLRKWKCLNCKKEMLKLKYIPFNALGKLGVCFYCRSKNLMYIGDCLKCEKPYFNKKGTYHDCEVKNE